MQTRLEKLMAAPEKDKALMQMDQEIQDELMDTLLETGDEEEYFLQIEKWQQEYRYLLFEAFKKTP